MYDNITQSPNNSRALFGVRLIAHAGVPETRVRMRLSEGVPVSRKFRAEFDAWLERFFGHRRVIYQRGDGALLAHPNTVKIIAAQVREAAGMEVGHA